MKYKATLTFEYVFDESPCELASYCQKGFCPLDMEDNPCPFSDKKTCVNVKCKDWKELLQKEEKNEAGHK